MATITVATTTAATAPAIAPTMTSPVLATGEEIVQLVIRLKDQTGNESLGTRQRNYEMD